MSVSSQKMCNAAIVVFCVMLSTAAVQAEGPPPRHPLMDKKCRDLSDDDSVRFFLSPVTDISKTDGMSFDKCSALDWFANFVECAIKKKKKCGRNAFRPTDCSNPDVKEAWLSDTIPSSSKACDITKAYLGLFCEGDRRIIRFPPPMYGSTNGRRLMQDDFTLGVIGFDGEGSASISTLVGNSAAGASASGGRGSRVKLNVAASEGPGVSRASSSARVTASPPSRKAIALTACKGTCCITLVLSGEMYEPLRSLASETSCPLFKPHGRPGGRRGRVLGP